MDHVEKTSRYAPESSTIDRARRKLESREKAVTLNPPSTAHLPGMIQKINTEAKSASAPPSQEIEALRASLTTPEDPRIAALRQKIDFSTGKK